MRCLLVSSRHSRLSSSLRRLEIRSLKASESRGVTLLVLPYALPAMSFSECRMPTTATNLCAPPAMPGTSAKTACLRCVNSMLGSMPCLSSRTGVDERARWLSCLIGLWHHDHHVLRHAGTVLAMRVRECRVRLMGWMPCHTALGRMPSPSYALVRCRALCVPRLVLCELACRIVNRAAALCVEDLDFLVQPDVA